MKDSFVEITLSENRAIELEFIDENFTTVPISGAFFEIYDSNLTKIVDETSAVITTPNKISTILSSEILTKSDIYYIIWKIVAYNQEFKHKTQVYVKDIL